MLRIICRTVIASSLLISSAAGAQAPGTSFSSPHYWPPSEREHQARFESELNAVASRASLRAFHDLFGSDPHIAGTPGDASNIQRLAFQFRMLGMPVQVHEFWAYLAKPIDAALEIASPEHIKLPIKEEPIDEDRYSKDRNLTIGFTAYSADGDVTAGIVYANRGTKEDFEALKQQGVDCTGKIVIARYGGNFRGYKAKFAQAAGAAGLLIYTDPDDAGDRKGPVYPEGGWANETCIQRGSIITLDYPGDPLTPGTYAAENAPRLNPDEIDLPRIPVQPIGYGAARQIMSRMSGRPLPDELKKEWQGGLPLEYRLEGGPDLRVRLMVKQERSITKTANIIATMMGDLHPEQKIIIGAHHDAWCHGAGDPLAGTILMYEVARCFYTMTEQGYTPSRTIVFAAWGAEEYGIIGSTEYCEDYADHLMETAVAYINLDASALGPNFGSSAAPSLKKIIEEVTRDVPQARGDGQQKIYAAWVKTPEGEEHAEPAQHSSGGADKTEPLHTKSQAAAPFGNLGGGSDHIAFYCHLGIPCCGVSAGGAPGNAYHSNYDNLHWYRKVVGEDYEPALMLTRVVNLLTARLANAPVLPLDPLRYAADTRTHLASLRQRAEQLNFALSDDVLTPLLESIDAYESAASRAMGKLSAALNADDLENEALDTVNSNLMLMERDWLWMSKQGEPEEIGGEAPVFASRPFFRNLFAASDPDSGYAAWMLPRLREAVEHRSRPAVEQAVQAYRIVFERLGKRIEAIERALPSPIQ